MSFLPGSDMTGDGSYYKIILDSQIYKEGTQVLLEEKGKLRNN